MALASSAGCLVLVLLIFWIVSAFGKQILKIAGLVADEPLAMLLYCGGVGFAALQLFLGIVGLTVGLTRRSVLAILALLAIAGVRQWKPALELCREAANNVRVGFQSSLSKLLAFAIAFFLILEGLLATAPLTGSDAMHYHFTAPLLEIGGPERPIFWLTHSFFTGLAHELIGMSLVLAGDKLALLLIFFAGCLTAAALYEMARRWMPVEWALAATLSFVMTPMVFWQISTAGSPDIWMGFYALLATLSMGQAQGATTRRWLLAASVLAGAGAGVKYTGWVLPAIVMLCVLWIARSIAWTALCSAAALVTGMLPQLRNALWTGDPFFPFLTRWIGKVAMNDYGLMAIRGDIHSHAFAADPLHIFQYLIAVTIRGEGYGLGQYFGPIILAFLPLVFFCQWRARLVWAAGAICTGIVLANALTTQSARFLLPAFPLALALVFHGAAAASRDSGARVLRLGCAATFAIFFLFCLASDAFYARDFLPVSLGLESEETFLTQMAPYYQATEFINSALSQKPGKALIFFRPSYYVKAPYENGDPNNSWLVNPEALADPSLLLAYLKKRGVERIVKSPDYPQPVSRVFEQSEREGLLVPEASGEGETLAGNLRIYNQRSTIRVVILQVAK